MYSSILVANDGSALGKKAFRHGLELASHLHARLAVVVAIEPVIVLFAAGTLAQSDTNNPAHQELQARSEDARLMLDDCALMASAKGLNCQTELVVESYPADAILQTSIKIGADLIIMASHGHRGFRQWILGSQTSEVLARSETPVLVVR